MDVERIPEPDGQVALWAFEWDSSTKPPAKANRQFLGYEQSARPSPRRSGVVREAICWSLGRTLGNVAVFADEILQRLSDDRGEDEILACDIVEAGKMRNGAKRWWCRTHQHHWGTKADIANALNVGIIHCSNHMQPMSYVIDPITLCLEDYREVAIHCSIAPAISCANPNERIRPKLHVQTRPFADHSGETEAIVDALVVTYSPARDLLSSFEFNKIYITPPTAFDFIMGIETGLEMDCIDCRDCGYPHLDIGEFGRTPHIKHLCSNCGRDNTWSREPIASTPLKPLYDRNAYASQFVDAVGTLNIDDYEGCEIEISATLPAVVWTARRPQKRGVRVKLRRSGECIIDGVFGSVFFRGQQIQRGTLLDQMVSRTIV